MPKIAVIIPVFNKEKYIERCLNSIINQKYNSLLIILINDGSVDNTIKQISKYKYYDNMVLISQENRGQGAARNMGINFLNYIQLNNKLPTKGQLENFSQKKINMLTLNAGVFNFKSVNYVVYLDADDRWNKNFITSIFSKYNDADLYWYHLSFLHKLKFNNQDIVSNSQLLARLKDYNVEYIFFSCGGN
ncbi:Chondroitin polymerase [Anaerobiospirillum thomasii]|uniref:glycosyltransferase family 2 protein n=1 Tax=Anaerobiospirillum thomasii TaxID=179995 RepID=UPI000D9F8294|nr:glycosyltransferase family A protein [Anaerobiospirillum thomasii]SPT68365.1 Chondroitin polymerase [Anaerobiospirillum thomasii]